MIRGMKKLFIRIAPLAIAAIPGFATAAASCPPNPVSGGPKGFSTIFSSTCVYSYEEWIVLVWNWAMGILIPLSVLIFIVAGTIYMTSEGDSNRVGIAKKMIIGVLSGVGLLILGRLLLIVIFGDASTGGWYF